MSTQQPPDCQRTLQPAPATDVTTPTTNKNDNESWKKANSTRDADSLAPLVDGGSQDNTPRRESLLKRILHRNKDDEKGSHDHNDGEKKKKSISEDGPLIFAFDPKLGKEVLQKNPHWPNEDSWKREKDVEGQWAMGSMMGQQGKDFGGTTG